MWMVAPPSSAVVVAACGLLHQAAACVRWLVTYRFWRVDGDVVFACIAHFLLVSSGSAVAAAAAQVVFHTAATVRLLVTFPFYKVSPSSLVSFPF